MGENTLEYVDNINYSVSFEPWPPKTNSSLQTCQDSIYPSFHEVFVCITGALVDRRVNPPPAAPCSSSIQCHTKDPRFFSIYLSDLVLASLLPLSGCSMSSAEVVVQHHPNGQIRCCTASPKP